MITRVVAYCRVSTEQQAERGLSLDAQRAQLEAYASLYSLEIATVEVDAGLSAKTLDRPALRRALQALERGEADGLLVCKLDRLTRSVRDLGELVERYFALDRWALLSVGEQIDTRTAAGRLVLNVLASVSQWEREAIGERTAAALRLKAARSEFTGGRVPYGYRLADDGKHLERDSDEQRAMQEAQILRSTGASLRRIARELDARGYRARSGRPFTAEQVSRLLAAQLAGCFRALPLA